MFFQRVVKGIVAATESEPGLDDARAIAIVRDAGLISNWWRNAPQGAITPKQVQDKLTEQALYAHLTDYERVRADTPFISTTAGTVEIDVARVKNVYFPPLYTALRFATRNFSQDGYLVYAYVFTLGKKSIELHEFAEEVRDINTYTAFYAWHPEGEIVAKVQIPARRIEKIERYGCNGLEAALDQGAIPQPERVIENLAVYRDPLQYANVRGFPEAP